MNEQKLLNRLKKIDSNLYNQDFLLTWKNSRKNIESVVILAKLFKELHKRGISYRTFDTGIAISNFRDKSTRTRYSFASAVNSLGLGLNPLDEEKSQISHGETVRETANMISFLTETVGIRDDMFIGEGDKYQREFSQAVAEGYKNGVLHRKPSVINLQSDLDHPTQTLADLCKLKNHFGAFSNLKNKKVAVTWAYSPSYGKPLSVPQGLIGLLSRFGMDISLAYPPGYELLPEIVDIAKKNSKQSGGNFEITNSMEKAFKDADIVYPKSWAPIDVMKQRSELLKQEKKDELNKLELECLARNKEFINWECNDKLMKNTKNENALYMHCLPADISDISCKHGEVSKNVFDEYKTHTYHQASYKPFVITAMIFLTRIENPLNKLEKIINNNRTRIL